MSCSPCQVSHSITGGNGSGASGPLAYFPCSRDYHPKELRLGEDACCTAGLRDPARLLDRWMSLRECWRPIRHGILKARARLPDCVDVTRTCGERPWRPPPSAESIAMVRAAISTAMGLTVDQGECQHAASTLRSNLFRALAQVTKDPDAHVANSLES